ncbi:prolyl-tRNA synthetase associated domain-containing protein [Streptomyces sp. NPDC048392]|uniref:prolyl-tRNA synthetase associated domain-containing protein n=1 Tax=Streptomyces sp. NPDC048392 TaxID=3365543 RepID=UPI0037206AFA
MTRAPDEAEAALVARLDALGIAWATERHEPVFTVEQAQALHKVGDAGGHAKNLFLKDRKRRLFLAVVEEGTPVDLKALGKAVGATRLSFGKPETLADVLGVTPGAVTPFALMNAAPGSISVVLDSELLARNPLHFHPLRNDATTAVSPQDLIAFLRACGHEPLLLDFRTLGHGGGALSSRT